MDALVIYIAEVGGLVRKLIVFVIQEPKFFSAIAADTLDVI